MVARTTAADFARQYTIPAIVLQLPVNDWSETGFNTGVRNIEEIISSADDDAGAPGDDGGLAVRWVEKSERNPYADRISIGRSASCDIVLRHPSVSKLHAHFVRSDSGWGLRDANSKNGVQVNHVRVGSSAHAPLAPGDHVRIGVLDGKFVDALGLYAIVKRMAL